MPYVMGPNQCGVVPFSSVSREDRVERVFLPLLDRLDLTLFQSWIRDNFASDAATV